MSTVFNEQPDTPDLTGDMDLEDRQALRRVSGLSTELQDVSEVEYRALRLERVVLLGVWTEGTLEAAERALRELALPAGEARELADLVGETGADTGICDGELTPSQLRKLEGVVKVKVVDRTALIL